MKKMSQGRQNGKNFKRIATEEIQLVFSWSHRPTLVQHGGEPHRM